MRWPAAPREAAFDPEVEAEIDALIEEHGDARAVIRALLHDLGVLASDLAAMERDGNDAASRGFLRGWFSEGARHRRHGQ